MPTDFSSFPFEPGNSYEIAVEPGVGAVKLIHHGEGQLEPQEKYSMLEFKGSVGSGPWREFRDWETETDLTINSHHIVEVNEVVAG